MSDLLFPQNPDGLFPENPTNPNSSGEITTPPTPEISSVTSAVGKVRITLALAFGDDTPSGSTFNIKRDGALIEAGVTDDTWSEEVTPDGSTHTYSATVTDPDGNESEEFTYSPDVAWSAPSGGGGSGGAYPVYIAIETPSVTSPLITKQGTVGQQLVLQLKHANGTPFDLTGKLAKMHMQPIGGGALKINSLVVVLLASMGIVSYTFAGTDTDTAGTFNLEFVITNTDGSPGVQTYPVDGYLRLKILASEG